MKSIIDITRDEVMEVSSDELVDLFGEAAEIYHEAKYDPDGDNIIEMLERKHDWLSERAEQLDDWK